MLKSRIKEQEKRGLILWKEDIEFVMRHKRGTGVGALLQEINRKPSAATKKNHIGSVLENKLKKISKVRHLFFSLMLSWLVIFS